jgi:hypothetical protein
MQRDPFGGTNNLMATKPTYPGQPGNINATPSAVSPGGSSISSPGGGYPQNPAQAPDQNSKVGAGIPQSPDYYSLGIEVLAVCPVGCGRAVSADDLGAHVQSHAASAYFKQADDSEDREVEV